MNKIATIAIAALLLASHDAAWAKRDFDRERPGRTDTRTEARISMGDAMDMVQSQTGGRILLAQPANMDGRAGYRIKVLTRRGDVRVFFVDANSGSIE